MHETRIVLKCTLVQKYPTNDQPNFLCNNKLIIRLVCLYSEYAGFFVQCRNSIINHDNNTNNNEEKK